MPYLVNGQAVTEERIRREVIRIRFAPRFTAMTDAPARDKCISEAAEFAAIDVLLVEQLTARDPRPVDAQLLESETKKQIAARQGAKGPGETYVRSVVEWNLRLQRTARDLTAGAPKPTTEEVESFYRQNRENFRCPAVFEAAHIVKHVNENQSEEAARAGIQSALVELEQGVAFADVADRHSDCKGKGSELGKFSAGTMVQEFEDAIRDLAPGERTGIFRTSFGFHIAELRSKTPAGPAEFAEVRIDIERVLTRIREHEEYLRSIADVRSRADIRWVPEDEVSSAKGANSREGAR